MNDINNNNKSQAELKTFYLFHNHQQQHSQKTFTQERQQQHEEGHHNSNNDINKNNNNKIFRSMLESGLHLRVHRLCQTWKQGRGTCSVQDSEALKVLFRSLQSVDRRIGDCKSWNKGGKFPLSKIYIPFLSFPSFSVAQSICVSSFLICKDTFIS